jgi:hypothetical protein
MAFLEVLVRIDQGAPSRRSKVPLFKILKCCGFICCVEAELLQAHSVGRPPTIIRKTRDSFGSPGFCIPGVLSKRISFNLCAQSRP